MQAADTNTSNVTATESQITKTFARRSAIPHGLSIISTLFDT